MWATEERCPGEGLAIGYPTRSPQHSVARRAKERDDLPPPRNLTGHDERVAQLISIAVRLLDASGRSTDRRLLRTFHGAHPGASTVMSERMADCCTQTGKRERATRNQVRQAEQFVEGWVQGAIQYAEMS